LEDGRTRQSKEAGIRHFVNIYTYYRLFRVSLPTIWTIEGIH